MRKAELPERLFFHDKTDREWQSLVYHVRNMRKGVIVLEGLQCCWLDALSEQALNGVPIPMQDIQQSGLYKHVSLG
ncbi:MAG: hypothetical protein L0177_00710 [Chloroflexi bacterium]|nr:hypothetical protein [Chloroflexota bacterium]